MNVKKLMFRVVVCALMAAPTLANITITPADGQYYTYQQWTFSTKPAGIPVVSNLQADSGYINNGTPYADVTLSMPYAYYSNWSPYQGVVYGSAAAIDLRIPNIIDEDLVKIIQVEVIYNVGLYERGVHGYIDASSYVVAGSDIYSSNVVDDRLISNIGGREWHDVTIKWRIPQIYELETIHLYFVDSGVGIDKIEAATVCIVPAPGAILLSSIGICLVGWLRKRKAL